MSELDRVDPQIADLIRGEEQYQFETLRLIPSENYASQAVMEASGSVLMNKYSEGYPGKRYYEGQRYIDQLETLVQERAKALFHMDHANVQPYSGSPANLAIYYALLEPGDTIMGLALPHGGHLTHGWNVNFSARFYRSLQYTVDEKTHLIDYDNMRALARDEKPKIIVAGATAYPRAFDFQAFGDIAKEVGAYFLADMSHISGLIVAGAHPDPSPFADVIMTTTHKTLRGPRGAMILCRAEHADAIDRAVFPALQGGPHNHTTAAIGVALAEAATPEFREYGQQVVRNAKALASELLELGFDLITGGTDTHLILIDLTNKGIIAKKAAQALDRAGIVVNYNAIPYDPRRPFSPSGIRIGTPSLTTRGMAEAEMRATAQFIARVVDSGGDEQVIETVRREVEEMASAFPVPGVTARARVNA
ncbi:MAG TPA: serine hydroxymethyltransferase [Dehalococcoidia bacterium]|jgi:glycine hydroxymethyltransferase|nr:serine hydroxymethyltransferase [Dehalococcoidia bacterium]